MRPANPERSALRLRELQMHAKRCWSASRAQLHHTRHYPNKLAMLHTGEQRQSGMKQQKKLCRQKENADFKMQRGKLRERVLEIIRLDRMHSR